MRLRISETMRGSHHFVDSALGEATDRGFHFIIDWGGAPLEVLNPFSSRFMSFDTEGVIFVEGLTDGEVPCTGKLTLDYIRSRSLTYELDFDAGDERYHYTGRKVDVDLRRPLMLVKTHTTCYGMLRRDDGSIVSRSVVHFEPEELLPFVRSVRLV
jgi:hypothetical protein